MKLPRQIYAIEHKPTKKRYIGSSANVRVRFQQHMTALRAGRHSVEDMQTDFDRYGGDYELTLLGDIETPAEKVLEYGWMLFYLTFDRRYGYNYKDPANTKQAAPGSRWRDPDVIANIKKFTGLWEGSHE